MKIKHVLLIVLSFLISIGCQVDINPSKSEINVKQGTSSIPCNSGYFNFGNIPLNFSQSITFTIENIGAEELELTGTPKVMISGRNISDFIVSTNFTDKYIQPNSSTTFSISFLPHSIGEKTAKISISNTDRDENPYAFTIIGTCTAPAPEIHIKQDSTDILNISGSYDFGMINVNDSSNEVIFTIENNGNENLNLTGNQQKININGNDPSMFVIDETNLYPIIPAQQKTTFSITFKPTAPGIKSAKISILNDDSDENPYTFNITGTAKASPEINIKQGSTDIPHSTGVYQFGIVLVYEQSTEVIFTIENIGTMLLQLTNKPDLVDISGTDASMFSVNISSTDTKIQQGSSTTFGLTFKPTRAGDITATVSIANDDDDESPYIFDLKGKCVAPEIEVRHSVIIPNSTGSFNFGTIYLGSSSVEKTFMVRNTGVGELKLTGTPIVAISGTDSSMFVVNDSSTVASISMSHFTSFGITFTPTSIGNKTATVSIANNDTDENPYTFTLNGECQNPSPEINVKQGSTNIEHSTGSYDFGSVFLSQGSGYITFVIENLGSSPLTLNGSPKISISGTDATMFDINQSATSTSVAPSGSTTFEIKFTPTSEGNKTATISIDNNDSDENPYVFTLLGKGSVHGVAIGWIGGGSNGWKTSAAPSVTGNDYQSYNYPRSTYVDSAGNLYVADTVNHRVCKWDSNGNAIGWIGGGSNGWKTTAGVVSSGTDYQSFNSPRALWVDSSGNIYVPDFFNNRVCKWDSNGNAIGWIGGGSNGWKTSIAPSNDTDYRSFAHPIGVCLDSSRNIYVADLQNHRVCKWDSNGVAKGWIGGGGFSWQTTIAPSSGSSDYESFKDPVRVFIHSNNIYVADAGNDRVAKWTSSGIAVGWIGGGYDGWRSGGTCRDGTDYKSFNAPYGICVASNGDIYVADLHNHRICIWDNSGHAKGWIGGGSNGLKTSAAPTTAGTDYQSFNYPRSVFMDSSGYLYISDTSNHRVSKWLN